VNTSKNPTLMRISNLVALGESLAIIAMGALYYVVFNKEYKTIALVALGCFLVAAITWTVGKMGANALIPLSQEFVEAGAPEASYFQTLGDFLYNGVDKRGYEIHILFNTLGFLLVNYLLYISGYIPRALSIWGLAAAFLLLIPTVLQLYDREFLPGAMILALPFAPY
jgi:prepilin signal peptidase PulO-like enzyme (type II secretory pathway)